MKSVLRSFIERSCRDLGGRFLDLGCGQMPYRDAVLGGNPRITDYLGMDIPNPLYPAAPLQWDGTTIPLPDDHVDTVLLTEVLEHCPRPGSVLAEVRRVLKPGGRAIITVPFLWPLHDVPGDYARITPFSLRTLAEENGLSALRIEGLGDWDLSTVQLLDLFLSRRLMRGWKKWLLKLYLSPVRSVLLSQGKQTGDIGESAMILDTGAILQKPLLPA